MSEENKNAISKTLTFSKDNPIIEISSKQSQTQVQSVTPPTRPKESKKE